MPQLAARDAIASLPICQYHKHHINDLVTIQEQHLVVCNGHLTHDPRRASIIRNFVVRQYCFRHFVLSCKFCGLGSTVVCCTFWDRSDWLQIVENRDINWSSPGSATLVFLSMTMNSIELADRPYYVCRDNFIAIFSGGS